MSISPSRPIFDGLPYTPILLLLIHPHSPQPQRQSKAAMLSDTGKLGEAEVPRLLCCSNYSLTRIRLLACSQVSSLVLLHITECS